MEHSSEQGAAGVAERGAEHEGRNNKPEGQPKTITIFVNAEARTVTDKEISFEEVVALASGLPSGPNILYSVSYQRGHGEKPTGTLDAGCTTKVKQERIFSVTATDRS
jgi:hypothetical protein